MNNCSLQWRAGQSSGQTTGRTNPVLVERSSFNGGPDNRPARRASAGGVRTNAAHLQWRAGQSSGQTVAFDAQRIWPIDPSMEGRTIVRPDLQPFWLLRLRAGSFNGGPDNRPARHGLLVCFVPSRESLQWRAGQSSGQTRPAQTEHGPRHVPSMEGRTIVRPDYRTSPTRRLRAFAFNGGPDNRPARLQAIR